MWNLSWGTVTWTEGTTGLPFLLAWPHCPTCMQDEMALHMDVLRQEGLVTEAWGLCTRDRLSLSQLPTPEPQITQARARPLLPWKCLAVFLRRACTVTSESAHSRTSLRPYKWVLWQSALKAFWRGQERAVCELWVPRSPSSPGTLGVWQGTGVGTTT